MFQGKNKPEPDFEIFVMYDSKVGNYRSPVFAINKHDILREIDTLFRKQERNQNQYFTNAEDFQLFKIGEYNKKTGTITPQNHEHIAYLHEIKSVVTRSENTNGFRDVSNDNNAQHQGQMGILPT